MARPLTIRARIETEDASTPTVNKVRESFSKLGDEIQNRFVITAGDMERAVRVIVDVLAASVVAAAESQDSIAALAASLENVGGGSRVLVDELRAQADAFQATTRNSDEAVISAQALLATYNVQTSQLKEATAAAVNLSAALGISLDQAAKLVGSTVSGVTREVERVVPALRDMSLAALESGEGITAIADALEGRAAAAAETFSGRLTILANALAEVQEAMGETVVESDGIALAMEGATVATNAWAASIRAMPGLLEELAKNQSLTARLFLAFREAIQADRSSEEWGALWTSVFGAVGDGLNALAAAFGSFDEDAERNRRVWEAVGNQISTAAGIAREFGFELESTLNARLTANENKLRSVQEAYRIGAIGIVDYQRAVAALAQQQRDLNAQLDGTAASARRATDELEALAVAMIPVNAGGLTLSQQISFGGGGVVSGTQFVGGGDFGHINAQSGLPPIQR